MRKLIFICLLFFINSAFSSVVMTGTRVVFPSDVSEKVIQFTNPDAQPYLVEVKLVTGTEENAPAAPFVSVPPVFRVEAHEGQSVRIVPTKDVSTLPQNKESLFYLSFTQIPALKASNAEKNQLIIAFANRVKFFYRPDSLKGLQSDAVKSLKFTLNGTRLKVENPTGFYISINEASFSHNGKKIILATNDMLSPFSTSEWNVAGKLASLQGVKLSINQVNDYGAYVTDERQL